ncbi:Gp157 family protein [Desulfonatronospira thiodismutans ASO3-1]|uniref:Gp157 family protein n=1 Tax=Desulfonatronospira thiodismutans ASO3-1 TaxID=555779 RepID=D6SV03_9BACT|nr:siphovirus Gp157 family protein [Desulfonatronospira thiodismutans]EFI32759.1 Gp157 family protein [Desulfonatronospira thiodismutans ASO3-1]
MPSFDAIQDEISNFLSVSEELTEDQHVPALNYLEELALQEQSKVDAIGYAVRKRKAEIDFLKQEEERIRHRRKSMENRLEEFKDYLLAVLKKHNLQKVKGLSSTIYTRNVSSVKLNNLDGIPEKFKKIVTEVKVDKRGIAEELKQGWHIPGVELEQRLSLTIR